MTKKSNSTVDATDRAIVRLFAKDAGITNLEVAQRLSLSEATVRRRRARLEAEKVIRVAGIVDPTRLGYETVVVIGIVTGPGAALAVEKQLEQLAEVHLLGLTTGRYDIILEVWLKDSGDLVRFITTTLAEVNGITGVESFPFIKLTKYYGWSGDNVK